MIIDCIACVDGVLPIGGTCSICSGVGTVEILTTTRDDTRWQTHCTVWKCLLERAFKIDDMEDKLDAMENKIDDIMDKCNDIKEVVDGL